MQTQWFSHLRSKDKQEEFKKLVLGSSLVLDRAKEICYNIVKNVDKTNSTDYDCPSWAFKQADRNGYLRAYAEILELLDVTPKEH